jgi:hypothetical protein
VGEHAHLVYCVASHAFDSYINALAAVNATWHLLFVLGRLAVHAVFGKLRAEEASSLQQQAVDYALVKTVLLPIMISELLLVEFAALSTWFVVVGVLACLTTLVRERLKILGSALRGQAYAHAKVLALLGAVALANTVLMVLCVRLVGDGCAVARLLTIDCVILFLEVLKAVVSALHHAISHSLSPCVSD